MKWASKYWQRTKAWNIWAREHKIWRWCGQWCDIWWRLWKRYRHDWDRRRGLDRLHQKKHSWRFGQDGTCKDSLLEQDTQKMKWKLALRIATSPSERWSKKAAEWNPDLSSRYRTKRAIGRPRKRWEDDINDFLKQNLDEKENEEPIERRIQNNNNWINIAKDCRKWALLEEKYTMKCVEWQKKKHATWSLNKAAAAQRSRALWRRKQQQCSGQEQCEGGQKTIKK